MIEAFKQSDGSYRLKDGFEYVKMQSQTTFSCRAKIKANGGEPVYKDGKFQHWVVPESALEVIGAHRMFYVRIAARCHHKEEDQWARDVEVKQGWCREGCLYCDTSSRCGYNVPIIHVYGELKPTEP